MTSTPAAPKAPEKLVGTFRRFGETWVEQGTEFEFEAPELNATLLPARG